MDLQRQPSPTTFGLEHTGLIMSSAVNADSQSHASILSISLPINAARNEPSCPGLNLYFAAQNCRPDGGS